MKRTDVVLRGRERHKGIRYPRDGWVDRSEAEGEYLDSTGSYTGYGLCVLRISAEELVKGKDNLKSIIMLFFS